MSSPFPGMDPFIEPQEWSDFHTRAITVIAELLDPGLGDRYVARVERRVYIDRDPLEEFKPSQRWIGPDIALLREPTGPSGVSVAPAGAGSLASAVECLVPQPETKREAYLVIRDPEVGGVVTVIELLSPTNKRPRSDGRKAYLRKRREVLSSDSHFVEIDLLRRGRRMPFQTPAPLAADYFALVSRVRRRPTAQLHPFGLRHRLPTIPIPLRGDDPDVPLDLQAVLDTVYDRARYGRTLNYAAPLDPPADDETRRWIESVLTNPSRPAAQPPRPADVPSEKT